jgi:hypothetical protein
MSSDLSATTITEDKKSPLKKGGGSKVKTSVRGKDNDNTSTSESSNSDISSKASSGFDDSRRSLDTYDSSDSDSAIANKDTMSSSMKRSPTCDSERDGFEEWRSKWEVFWQDHRLDEFQSEILHPDLLVDGHATVSMLKEEKKALKKNKKAIASIQIQISFASTYSVDVMIESTIDESTPTVMWPYILRHLHSTTMERDI